MCGRFALVTEKKILEMLYGLELRNDLRPRYNIAPAQDILSLRRSPQTGEKEFTYLKWGLVPFWAKDSSIGSRMINARSETAAEKPAFRDAYKKRRIIIPASGFFEWKKKEKGVKQPYYINRKDDQPLSLAGLWERWEKGDEILESCTILTTEPNQLVAPLHDRMPVIISLRDIESWLAPEFDSAGLLELLKPYAGPELTARPVSQRVNSPANETPDILDPL